MRRLNREIHAFQPTPSLRRATTASEIRAMRYAISTHALLAEGDEGRDKIMAKPSIFQPTPSLRRATCRRSIWDHRQHISTHALLAEGDANITGDKALLDALFQPTPSLRRATRYPKLWMHSTTCYFNPRPPCGGRLYSVLGDTDRATISTHALLAEGDPAPAHTTVNEFAHFNPRPPCGGRQLGMVLFMRHI